LKLAPFSVLICLKKNTSEMTVMLTCVKQPAAMKIGGFMMGVLLVSLLLGCSRTVTEHGAIVKQIETGDAAATGFLAGAIDKRAGGLALSSAAQWQWDDAENA
jgi:hypothetical protein